MAKVKEDKQQIGLTADANEAIARIANEYFGGQQLDAYRFAISYAIAADLDLTTAPQSGYQTKYHGDAVESAGSIRSLLEILGVGDPSRPRATAEKLAEIGVRDIARRLDGSETLADIMASVAMAQTAEPS